MLDPTVDLCQVSAAPSPDGHSNFVNPTTLASTTIAVQVIMVTWATAFTAARFFINMRKLGWGDYFALVAVIISVGLLGYGATQLRMARHIWDVPMCYFDANYARWVYTSAILLQLGQFFAKASIFFLFNQLFTIQKPMRIAIWIGFALNCVIYGVGIIVATYFEAPRAGETWMNTLDGRAIKPIHWWQAQSALLVALDFYIFVLPLRSLSRLNMPLRRRIPVIAVFSLALMGIGASIASLVERIQIARETDATWISSVLTLCSSVELNVAIIVSSAPGFAGMTRTYLPKLSSYFSSKTTNSEVVLDGDGHGLSKSGRSNNVSLPQEVKLGHDGKYYELNDTWVAEGGAVEDEESFHHARRHGEGINGGIMRTVALQQDIKTVSEESLVK